MPNTTKIKDQVSIYEEAPSLNLEGINNFRDVGKTVNSRFNRKILNEGRLFRSGRPGRIHARNVDRNVQFLITIIDNATSEALKTLKSDFHLQTILDLRTESEHSHRIEPAQKIITTHQIYFLSSKFNHQLLLSLPWYTLIYFLFLLLIQKRDKAIGLITRYVMQPMGLAGVARRCLIYCKPEIKEVFTYFTQETSYPLLVHCTQGKDRTGLTVLLALMLVLDKEDPMAVREAVEYDYMLTNAGLLPVRDEMLKEMRTIGFSDDSGFVDAPKGWVGDTLDFIAEKWGDIPSYLLDTGLSREQLQQIKSNLLCSTTPI